MNGSLYPMPNGALMDPATVGLLRTGLGMMAASGPSRTPVSLGQVIGQGGMQGLDGYQQALAQQQQSQLFGLKMSAIQREDEERKKREEAQKVLLADPRFAQYGPMIQAGLPLSEVLAREMPKPKTAEPFSLKPGETRYDASGNIIVSQPAVEKPEKPKESDLTVLLRDRDALPVGDPRRALYDAKIKKLTTHQPLVTVDTRQEGEFGKAVGREMGEMYTGILRADMNAPASIAKYERLGNLLGSVNTGKFKGTTTDLKAAAKGLGIDLSAMGITDDVAPAQAAKALSNQLALELRNPAGGAGMPGAMSDADRVYLTQMVPSLENDPGAVNQMVDYRIRLAKREQQVARMAREYRRKNGKFDEGFFDKLQEWSDKNPIFPEAGRQMPNLSPKAQQYIDAVTK